MLFLIAVFECLQFPLVCLLELVDIHPVQLSQLLLFQLNRASPLLNQLALVLLDRLDFGLQLLLKLVEALLVLRPQGVELTAALLFLLLRFLFFLFYFKLQDLVLVQGLERLLVREG